MNENQEPQIDLGFDPRAVRAALDKEPWSKDGPAMMDNDQECRSVYLGRMIWPSGKFYMPWATSNVESCPSCNGQGSVVNPDFSPLQEILWKTADRALRNATFITFGAACNGEWPDELASALRVTQEKCFSTQYKITCETCGGLGSQEAYLDELWREKCDALYDRYGYSIENGENDPTDVFAAEYRTVEEG